MIVLDNVNRTLQIILAGAKNTNDCPIAVSYEDVPAGPSSTGPTAGENATNTNGVTAVTLASAPPAGYIRRIKSINLNNADLAAITLSVRYNDNGTTYVLYKITLQTLEQLTYEEGYGFVAYDSGGAVKSQAVATSSATSLAMASASQASVSVSQASISLSAVSSQTSSIATAVIPASVNSVSSQASSMAALVPASVSSNASLGVLGSSQASSLLGRWSVTISKTSSSFSF